MKKLLLISLLLVGCDTLNYEPSSKSDITAQQYENLINADTAQVYIQDASNVFILKDGKIYEAYIREGNDMVDMPYGGVIFFIVCFFIVGIVIGSQLSDY